MTKKFFIIIISAILLIGCKNSSYTLSQGDILGTWIVYGEDGKAYPTNDCFMMNFNPNFTEDYAVRVQTTPIDNAVWRESIGETKYSIEGDIISFSRSDLTLKVSATAYWAYETDGTINQFLVYKELEHIESGVDLNFGRTFVARRPKFSFKNEIIGLWEGLCITEGEDPTPHRWEYFTDGTYKYYTKNPTNNEWEVKSDNNGKYYLYGELMVTTWVNDYISGLEGDMCELWEISMNDRSSIMLTATRQNSKKIQFSMTKVQ